MRFSFVEKRLGWGGNSSYRFPNESLNKLRELVEKVTISKAAAIASGGEVPLTVVLPHAQSVVAVDHNYGSLRWALLKALLVEHHDAATLKKHMEGGASTLLPLFEELRQDLPEAVRPNSEDIRYFGYDTFCKWWSRIEDRLIDAARERLDQLTFVHGDIRDVEEMGPYDLVYFSNAHEHGAYDGGTLGMSFVNKLAGRKGFILYTTGFSFPKLPNGMWQQVKRERSGPYEEFFPGELQWSYILAQRTEPEPAPA